MIKQIELIMVLLFAVSLSMAQEEGDSLAAFLTENCQESFCSFEVQMIGNDIRQIRPVELPMDLDSLERYLDRVTADSIPSQDSVGINASAAQIRQHCELSTQCSTIVTLRKKNFAVVEFRTPEISNSEIQTPEIQEQELPKDTIEPVQESTALPEAGKNESLKKDRMFYFGLSLGFEQFQEVTVANHEVLEADELYDHLGASFGFLLRWYFFRLMSFQVGLNGVYHHGFYDIEESDFRIGWSTYYYKHDVTIDYHSIMAEIPLTFRLGLPFVISPYVSLSLHARKPIYAWIDYDVDVSWQLGELYSYDSRDREYDDSSSKRGPFNESDWDFLGYLGFGVELTRHFSIQWQMLLFNVITYTDETVNYKLLTDTWRVGLDVAF